MNQVWRTGLPARTLSWVILAGSAAATLACGLNRQRYPALIALVLAGVAWSFGLRPRLVTTEAGIEIHNPLRTVRIGWADLEGAVPGTAGVIVLRRDRRPVKAWAVQKSTLSHWLGRPARADEVARHLVEQARQRRAQASPR